VKEYPETIDNAWDVLYREYPEIYDAFSSFPYRPGTLGCFEVSLSSPARSSSTSARAPSPISGRQGKPRSAGASVFIITTHEPRAAKRENASPPLANQPGQRRGGTSAQ
jgi:hypothetical protein